MGILLHPMHSVAYLRKAKDKELVSIYLSAKAEEKKFEKRLQDEPGDTGNNEQFRYFKGVVEKIEKVACQRGLHISIAARSQQDCANATDLFNNILSGVK